MGFLGSILENVVTKVVEALSLFVENLILGFILPILESLGIVID